MVEFIGFILSIIAVCFILGLSFLIAFGIASVLFWAYLKIFAPVFEKIYDILWK